MSKIYDVIILGAGPAGLAAGLYAGRARLSTLILEKGQDGGQIAITDEIENYPGGMVDGEPGPSLIARMTQQAAKFGAERANYGRFHHFDIFNGGFCGLHFRFYPTTVRHH